jgi:hypothetical protein
MLKPDSCRIVPSVAATDGGEPIQRAEAHLGVLYDRKLFGWQVAPIGEPPS